MNQQIKYLRGKSIEYFLSEYQLNSPSNLSERGMGNGYKDMDINGLLTDKIYVKRAPCFIPGNVILLSVKDFTNGSRIDVMVERKYMVKDYDDISYVLELISKEINPNILD